MTTELKLNPDYTAALSLQFPEEPNADTAFVFGDTEPPKRDKTIEDVVGSCRWMSDVLIKAGMLYRWQDPDLAKDKMHNGLLPDGQIMHSTRLHTFLLPPSQTDPELAGPRIEGFDEERLSQVAFVMMDVGKQYLRLGGAIQKFTEGEGVERELISHGYRSSRNKEVFTRRLPEGSRIHNIGTLASIKSVHLSFLTLQREDYEEADTHAGNRIYVTLQNENGLYKQLELGYGYSREKGGDQHASPTYTPPELAAHPVRVWVNGHDTTYLGPTVPESSDNNVWSVTDRVIKILPRAKGLQEK